MGQRTRQFSRWGRQGWIAWALLVALTVQQVVILGHVHFQFEGVSGQAEAAARHIRATGATVLPSPQSEHAEDCTLCAMAAAAGSRNVAAAVFVHTPEFSRRERRLFAAFIAPGAPQAASFEARGPPAVLA